LGETPKHRPDEVSEGESYWGLIIRRICCLPEKPAKSGFLTDAACYSKPFVIHCNLTACNLEYKT
jgi:hypothetical protein